MIKLCLVYLICVFLPMSGTKTTNSSIFDSVRPISDQKTTISSVFDSVRPISDQKTTNSSIFDSVRPISDHKTTISSVFDSVRPISDQKTTISSVFDSGEPLSDGNATTSSISDSGEPLIDEKTTTSSVFDIVKPLSYGKTTDLSFSDSGEPISDGNTTTSSVSNSGEPISDGNTTTSSLSDSGEPLIDEKKTTSSVFNNDEPTSDRKTTELSAFRRVKPISDVKKTTSSVFDHVKLNVTPSKFQDKTEPLRIKSIIFQTSETNINTKYGSTTTRQPLVNTANIIGTLENKPSNLIDFNDINLNKMNDEYTTPEVRLENDTEIKNRNKNDNKRVIQSEECVSNKFRYTLIKCNIACITVCRDVLQIGCSHVIGDVHDSSGDGYSGGLYDDTDDSDGLEFPYCDVLIKSMKANVSDIDRQLGNTSLVVDNGNVSHIVCSDVASLCGSRGMINLNIPEVFKINPSIMPDFSIRIHMKGQGDDTQDKWLSITSPLMTSTRSTCSLDFKVQEVTTIELYMVYNGSTTLIYTLKDSTSGTVPVGLMKANFQLKVKVKLSRSIHLYRVRLINCFLPENHVINKTDDEFKRLTFGCDFEDSFCPMMISVSDSNCSFDILSGLDNNVKMTKLNNHFIKQFLDHTLNSYLGHFLYITGEQIMSRQSCKNTRKAIITTVLLRPMSRGFCSFKLSYKGNIGFSIHVRLENHTSIRKHFIDEITIHWRDIDIDLTDIHSWFYIEILTIYGPRMNEFLAIDDLYFSDSCNMTIFKTENVPEVELLDVNDEITVVAGAAGGCVVVFGIMLSALFIVKRRMQAKGSRTHRIAYPYARDWLTDTNLPLLPKNVTKPSYLTRFLTIKNPNYEWYTQRLLNCTIQEIPRSRLKFSETSRIGKGAFGEVFSGILNDSTFEGRDVALKRIQQSASDLTRMEFFFEALTISKFTHANIVECLGISLDKASLMLVLELLPGGDLKTFLRSVHSLSLEEQLDIVHDVARACQYLEGVKFIHRDIAARNCLLTSKGKDRIVKLADFGLARDVIGSEYYRKSGSALLPVRWMPPESFMEGHFSSKSDIWSFGVLMWEVFSYGLLPYSSYSNSDVLTYVRSGGRLEKPCSCSMEIYNIMMSCWALTYTERPTFTDICSRIKTIHKVFRQDCKHGKRKCKSYTQTKRQNIYTEEELEPQQV